MRKSKSVTAHRNPLRSCFLILVAAVNVIPLLLIGVFRSNIFPLLIAVNGVIPLKFISLSPLVLFAFTLPLTLFVLLIFLYLILSF